MSALDTRLPTAYRKPLRRCYRQIVGEGRFKLFELRHRQSDLLVGVDIGSWRPELPFLLASRLAATRTALEGYLARHPAFAVSLSALPDDPDAPSVAVAMLHASTSASVGPMAAVAGAVADELIAVMVGPMGCQEAFIENGGDCSLVVRSPLTVAIVGTSDAFSGRVGIRLPAGTWGVATSAGRLGPSLSLGRADACTAVARTAALADAWATALGNRIGGPLDIERALVAVDAPRGPLAVFACSGDRAGFRGCLDLVPIEIGREAFHECRP
ncbi:MAG: UPF0280 family protein [Spirochaetales bacterium]|nr:MAG: UPF0280 family protein [Spirochaetales bacterium]